MNTDSSGAWHNKMLGRYRLLHVLGKGGMGEVWLAEDTQLLRQVAIKVLPGVLAADSRYLEDFAREARAAAALEHPHILPVHDFGEQQIGDNEVVTFLVTPYMSGGSLRERILAAQGPLLPAEVMGYLRQAAQAIDYAHSQSMLHRDIKPANMLLERSWLFLADFGIAKLLTGATQRTRTYAGSGTPEYMAPEQVRGKAEAASDRYSFAVTAYQLVTGRVPFKGETPYSTLIMQMTEEPASPRSLNPDLPEAAERAILWGLAKDPADRPESCMALVHALEHDWQIQPLPQLDPQATLLASYNRSDASPPVHPLTPSSTIGTPGTLGTPVLQSPTTPPLPATHSSMTTIPSAHALSAPETPRPYASDAPTALSSASARQTEERQRGTISRRALLAGAATAAVTVAVGGTALYLRAHSTPTPSTPYVSRPAPGPKQFIAGVPLLSLVGHTQPVRVARWHPDGRYLATGGEDDSVMLWDIGGSIQPSSHSIQSLSAPLRRWKLPENVLANSLCWSADGRTLAAATGSNHIYLISAFTSNSTPSVYQDASSTSAYTAIAWSPVANSFATPNNVQKQTKQVVDIWQVGHTTAPEHMLTSNATGTARTAIIDVIHPSNATAPLNAISWSNDGSLLATHTNFGTVPIWQAATGTIKETISLPLRPTKDHPYDVLNECLAWSPVKANLLAVSNIDVATLWDIQQNKQLLTLNSTDPVPALTGLAWSPNGSYLAGSYAGSPRIYVWDIQKLLASTGINQTTPQSQKLFFPQSGMHVHTATITDVVWSPDGRYIATASGDTTSVVWKVDGG